MPDFMNVLARHGFCGYMGPGYSTRHAVNEFMRRYPRGKGIKGHQKDLHELYAACREYKKAETKRIRVISA
jgi:hypothetical protein